MSQHITVRKIEHNGVVVAERGEMMSLTDMWKAAGSPSGRAPADWLALVSSKEFVACVEASFDAGNPGIKTMKGSVSGKRGGGGTFGHWQIGLAYAKYLDPVFHMKCNQIVRERMEGRNVAVTNLPPDVLELVRRSDGIARMLAHKVTSLETSVAKVLAVVTPSAPVLIRHGRTAGQIWTHYHLPRLKSASVWFGNRLAEMGCLVDGRAEHGASSVRLFDPDKADVVMKAGLSHGVKAYVGSRQGQGQLRLVPTLKGGDA